jgi:hypothetical protein
MALTQTWSVIVKNSSGASVVTDTIAIVGDVEEDINETVLANAVKEIDAPITVAAIQGFCMETALGCTIKFNSSTTPASPSPITLTANQAYAWKNTDPGANPLTVNITKIYVDNTANPTKANTFKATFCVVEGV